MKNRILKIILAFSIYHLAFSVISAQTLRIGAATSYADSNVTYGITAGADVKLSEKFLLSSDADGFHLCKHAGNGGCGYEYSVRGLVAYFLSKKIAVQGGVAQSRYKVERYGKSSTQYLVGVRDVFSNSLTGELNFRHDLTSPNRSNFLEVKATNYRAHHLFIRGNWAVETLRDAGKDRVIGSLGFAFGFYH